MLHETKYRTQSRLVHTEFSEATTKQVKQWNDAIAFIQATRQRMTAQAQELPATALGNGQTAGDLLKMRGDIIETLLRCDLEELALLKQVDGLTAIYSQELEAYAKQQEGQAQKRADELTIGAEKLGVSASSVISGDPSIAQAYTRASNARSQITKGASRPDDTNRADELAISIATLLRI